MPIGLDFFLRRASATQRRAGIGDFLYHGLFLFGETFDGLDKIGNQIGTALQRDVHLCPSRVDRFALGNQRVPRARGPAEDAQDTQDQHSDDD